jgi:hypothetical protein
MKLTVMVIAEPSKVNYVLAALAEKGIEDINLQPISLSSALAGQDVMITYQVEEDCKAGAFAHLSWMEEKIGQWCKVY